MIIPVPVSSENLNFLFTDILPKFMQKYGFKILSFELIYLLPIIILWLFFKFLFNYILTFK